MPHTPGPWRRQVSINHYDEDTTDILGPKGENIAVDVPDDFDSLLIAAAPELLEALKEIKEVAFSAWSGGVVKNADEAISRADKTIAKAEGR